jgi:NADH dehydrogenase FAD-containing subunit
VCSNYLEEVTMMGTKQTKIVVIGAGYAGLLAAVRLAGNLRKSPVRITLVSASDTYVERLRLHQLATGRPVKSRSVAQVLRGTGVIFVQGHVTSLDPSGCSMCVQTETGPAQLEYDRLVYALGSVTDCDRVPGVRDHAYTLSTEGPFSVLGLRERLFALNASAGTLVVCGAGPTGIESSAAFAAAYPNIRVRLITAGAFGRLWGNGSETPPAGDAAAEYMRKSLSMLGVTIQEQTTATEVGAAEIQTDKGAIAYDLCLWTGGFVAPALARQAGLSVNERGQILVDPFLRSISHPDVTAVGDAAHPVEEPGVHVRMCAATAVVMGAHGADCLAAELWGRTPKALSFAYQGQCIALGPHSAIGFNNFPDDIPNRPFFTGRAGYWVRELVLGYLVTLPAMERRWPGSYFWFGKGRYAASQRDKQELERAKEDDYNQDRKVA